MTTSAAAPTSHARRRRLGNGWRRCRHRRCRHRRCHHFLLHRRARATDRSDQPVAALGDGLDEGGTPWIVAERPPQLDDGLGQCFVPNHHRGPHTVEQFLPADDGARPIGKPQQDLHHLRLDAYRSSVTDEFVGIRIDLPVADRQWRRDRRARGRSVVEHGAGCLQVLDSQHLLGS